MNQDTRLSNLKKLKRLTNTGTFRAILAWVKPVRAQLVIICVIACVGSLFSLMVTLTTKSLIDGATSQDRHALILYGALLAGLILVERLMSMLNGYLRIQASAKLQRKMQSDVTSAILGKDYASIKPFHSGELVNRVFSDVSVVKNGVMNILPAMLRTLVSFVGAAIILIGMDWRFVPLLILAGTIGAALALLFRNPMKRRHKRMQAAEDRLHASTQETLENIRVVKASATEEKSIERMDEDRDALSDEQLRNGKLSLLMNNGMGMMFDLSWLVCNVWGCVKIFHDEFSYGSLAAMIQLIGRIQAPIANALSLVSQIYGVMASAERLEDVLGLPDEDRGTALEGFDRIEISDMSFQYDDGISDVLLNVNCTINAGEFVALTGMSGGGKTSLFQLLLGIYKPTSGSVKFVSGDIKAEAGRGTRELFAYVPQGNTLFSGTLKENLTRFTQDVSDDRLNEAVRLACLDDLTCEIGLDAKLGERGIGLSEGQAQRVAIARALLSDKPILLLDEGTSALDELTEAKLLKNISELRDKTCIIVTHRRAALEICDYRLQINDGTITKHSALSEDEI